MPCAEPVTTIALPSSRFTRVPLLRRGLAAVMTVGYHTRALPLAERRIADGPADEDRDPAVVARKLRGRAFAIAGAHGLEEALVVFGRVLQRRPAERARDLLAKPRDERHEPRTSGHPIEPDVEALPGGELRLAGLRPDHLLVHALERGEVLVGHERHRETDGVALEQDAELVDLLDV